MVIGSVEVVGTVVSYVVVFVVITDILATVASIDFAILELVVTLEVELLSASTQIDTSYYLVHQMSTTNLESTIFSFSQNEFVYF